MKNVFPILLVLAVIPFCGYAWATTDLSTLGSPDVAISSSSGPPGTNITITVSHIPDTSGANYPYPDLYIYLPFSQPFGTTISSHCGGEDCFPIYTHDDALNHNLAERTITFSLPSMSNPKPVFLNGFENTVCDVIINGKTVERFSTLCNTKDEPQGLYQIRIGWVLETDLEQKYTVKTIPFLVTAGVPQPSSPVAENGNTILNEYQNGTISESQFYTKLKARGWTDEQIRQALAVIGRLPHQMGVSGPDANLSISQTNSSVVTANIVHTNATNQQIAYPEVEPVRNPSGIQLDQASNQKNQSSPVQDKSVFIKPALGNVEDQPAQSNPMWSVIIIGLSVAAAAIMSGVTIFAKMQRGKRIAR